MTLAEYQEQIAPHLHGIEGGAEMCRRHVRQLIFQPEFETLAFEEIQKTEKVLTVALERVRAASRAFRELPHGD